ncbi:hypothetical protein [Edaphocola aurantiacus]|uniref:hypothetical protein n=1 Tax=Edaphocola aurantiacus TaxID=2601682 RepID=UPI001C983DF2|nr:hypothetical protein [Edaphocola aurantiacus]
MEKAILVKLNDLFVDVYIIGYPTKGESQIFILRNQEGHIYFSCVIDCYSHNNFNRTTEILSELGIGDLDIFIWTHTDDDHSIGICDLINNHCNENTYFYLPEFINGNVDDLVNYNVEVMNSMQLINSFNVGTSYSVNTITIPDGGSCNILNYSLIDNNSEDISQFQILAIAPNSALLRRRNNNGRIGKKNDFSIATLFRIGMYNLFFGGDIENQTINRINESYFRNLSFIKTPHHTSNSSSSLLTKINANELQTIPFGATTVYAQHNLPNFDLISDYKNNIGNFYSTGIGDHNSGTVHIEIDISKGFIDTKLIGNAHQL